MWSISILHVGTDQTDSSPSPSPNPNPNPNPTPNPFGDSRLDLRQACRQGRSRGSAACFGGVLLETPWAAERPASTDQKDIHHEIRCLPVLHLGRVPWLRVSERMWRSRPASIRPSVRSSHHLADLLRVPVVSRDFDRLMSGYRLTQTVLLGDSCYTEQYITLKMCIRSNFFLKIV